MNVLVIDDSPYSRVALRGMIETMDGFRATVSTAVDGLDGYRQALKREPDLIMLDLEMPEIDGFTFLRLIRGSSVPVIVVSGTGSAHSESKALELGASAYIEKLPLHAPESLFSIKGEISEKLSSIGLAASRAGRRRFKALDPAREAPQAVIIGASTGGPRAVGSFVRALPAGLPCVFVVSMHMPPWLTAPFADRLNAQSLLPVRVAVDGAAVEKGEVVVAPGGRHISFAWRKGRIVTVLEAAGPADQYSPSIDRAFSSGAAVWGAGLVGAVMTGMGEDGSEGIVNIKKNGGVTLSESRESAVVYSMSEAAQATGAVDRVLTSAQMGEWIAGRFRMGHTKLA